MDARIRAYDPSSDRDQRGLWACKRGFELGLGEGTGDDEKQETYAAKLTDEYRTGYLEWVERCQADEPDAVTVAVLEEGHKDDQGAPESNTPIIGYVFVLPDSFAYIWDSAVINEIYVTPEYRGTGVADALMARALEVTGEQELPLERLVLDVDRANDRAQAFYERHGFDHWGELVARSLE